MAEIKIDLINYCNVNMSSPNSCNSSNLNQPNSSSKSDQIKLGDKKSKNIDIKSFINDEQLISKLNQNSPTNSVDFLNNLNIDQLNCESTKSSQFYVNNDGELIDKQNDEQNDKQNDKQNNKQNDKQNEKQSNETEIDQFDNDFEHFNRKTNSTNEQTYNRVLNNNFVTNEDIGQLLKAFQDKAFRSGEYRAKDEKIQLMCLNLFNYDYKQDELMIINNIENDLSSSYPLKIIIPKTKAFPIDTERLRNLILKAKYARARCRFPAPVILFNNKYICRSATLSHCIEIYSRQSYASFFKTGEEEQQQMNNQEIASEISEMNLDSLDSPNFDVIDPQLTKQNQIDSKLVIHNKSNGYFSAFKNDYSQTVDEARTQDISLLNYLKVKHIIDLMVENKKVKYGLYVASSEKADKFNRYRDFNINVLPYPGCEFFKLYRDNNYQGEGLIYDWNQSFVDAHLSIPKSDVLKELDINFDNYKTLDVNNLTLNYLKLILSYMIAPTNESILLHCISGWDRTSLVLSLIRLSLWADYELHPNLNYEQILYLTLGYDWYLFGHDLNDRVEKGEEIMHYCFYFLKFLSTTEYSIDYLRKNIVKKGNEYVRIRFDCCGQCKEFNNNNNNNSNGNKNELSVTDLDEEISSSMYSSQASTVVNNNLKKEQILNHFNADDDVSEDTDSLCSDHTPKDSSFNSCFLTQEQEQSGKDAVDHQDLLTNSTISTKTFVIDSNFDANISASPSSFTSTFKDLRNNSATSLNRNSLTIETNSDLNNRFDVISLDDQSLSSNSSYDVLHNKHQQQHSTPYQLNSSNQLQPQQSTPTNQPIIIPNVSTPISSPNQQVSNDFKQQINKSNNSSELSRKDSFSCGSPPQLLQMTSNLTSNIPNEMIADEDERAHHKLIEDEDLLSSSGESNTLAEDTVDSSLTSNTNIQRSNAVAIPSSRNRSQSKFSNSSADQSNWSNNSNLSNRLSEQSFNLNRCDSWQMVTDTGSLRDKTFLSSTSLDEIKRNMNLKLNNNSTNGKNHHHTPVNCKLKQNQQNNYVATCCCKNLNCGKHCEKVEKFNKENDLEKFVYTRMKRLSDVRVVFYQCYSKYIGLSTPNGASGNEITTKFSNLINKIKYPFRTTYTGSNGFTRNGSTRLSNRRSSQFQSYLIEDEVLNKPVLDLPTVENAS